MKDPLPRLCIFNSLEWYNEIKEGFDGYIYNIVKHELKGCCSGCVVSSGIFKSMLVTSELALPKDVKITTDKDN